jgi:UDP-N-acetylmuramate--alanine ligase
LYAENLEDTGVAQQQAMIEKIGKRIPLEELSTKMDFAFLCLHGPFGEDGRLQGLLDYLQIPYSGSGVLPSAIGIDKALQKELMVNKGFNSPSYITIRREHWIEGKAKDAFQKVSTSIGFPCVVKPANQGSSIGVSILTHPMKPPLCRLLKKLFLPVG